MISQLQIKNFKSIDQLTIELGRFNVLIGANGCGKTNILETLINGPSSQLALLTFLPCGSA